MREWLKHNYVTLSLILALGYGAFAAYDNGNELKSQQTAACGRNNVIRLYLQYDAQYNANLPTERQRFVRSLLPVLDCDAPDKQKLTPVEAVALYAKDVRPAADKAGLPRLPCTISDNGLRICEPPKP